MAVAVAGGPSGDREGEGCDKEEEDEEDEDGERCRAFHGSEEKGCSGILPSPLSHSPLLIFSGGAVGVGVLSVGSDPVAPG